jgi:hypothetical protein
MIGRLVSGLLPVALVAVLALGSDVHAQGSAPPEGAPVGTLSGAVIERGSGQPIIEAGVEVVGTGKKTKTDLDGHYQIKVPPGTHEVRFFAAGYQGARLQKVTIKPNEVTKLDTALATAGQAGVDVVEVTAQADRATEATQLLKRKEAPVVTDNISAETIKKTPGSAASDVAKRAPAVTIRNEGFVFVRGLSERYTSAQLNGSRLPSTDPSRRVIPLYLFPADFLESLNSIKSYSPDLPGDFGGALVDLSLREFPEQLTGSVGATVGANTQATFKDFQTYEGSRYDLLTYGDSFRAIPKGIPERFQGEQVPNSEARRFKDIWGGTHGPPDIETAPENYSANFSVGNSWGPFGFQLGGNFRNEWWHIHERERQFINNGTIDDPDIAERDDFLHDRSLFNARLGGLLTSSYKYSLKHKFNFRALWNRNARDEVKDSSGKAFGFNSPGDGEQFDTTQMRWTEEELAFGQLSGEHQPLDWLRVDWRSAFSHTTQDEPDTRYLTYEGPKGQEQFLEDSLGGLRLFNSLEEILTDSAVDFTVPFRTGLPYTDVWADLPAKFKAGPAYSFRDRDFTQRRFQNNIENPQIFDLRDPAEVILDPMNYAPGANSLLEETQQRDQFSATQEVIAGYGLFDMPIVRDRLKFYGGVRLEYSYIELVTFDLSGSKQVVRKNTLDPLPGVSLIYTPLPDHKVMGSWSRTVSRPEFRELSPTQYPAQRGSRPLFGNPDLVQMDIESYDLRWDWFFTPLELASLSFFYKKIDNPIEQVIFTVATFGVDSFANAEEATLIGGEMELRKNFGFLWHPLRHLMLITNFAYIDSEVTTPRGAMQVQTNTQRPLQGQPGFVAGAVLDYDNPDVLTARLLYNTADRVLTNAGSFGLPDIYEERRDQLDAVLIFPLQKYLGAPFQIRMAAENILNQTYHSTQGDELQRLLTTGVKFTLGFSYSFSGGPPAVGASNAASQGAPSPPSGGTEEGAQ